MYAYTSCMCRRTRTRHLWHTARHGGWGVLAASAAASVTQAPAAVAASGRHARHGCGLLLHVMPKVRHTRHRWPRTKNTVCRDYAGNPKRHGILISCIFCLLCLVFFAEWAALVAPPAARGGARRTRRARRTLRLAEDPRTCELRSRSVGGRRRRARAEGGGGGRLDISPEAVSALSVPYQAALAAPVQVLGSRAAQRRPPTHLKVAPPHQVAPGGAGARRHPSDVTPPLGPFFLDPWPAPKNTSPQMPPDPAPQ